MEMRCGLMQRIVLKLRGEGDGVVLDRAERCGATLEELMYVQGLLNELRGSAVPATGATGAQVTRRVHRAALRAVSRVLRTNVVTGAVSWKTA